MTPTSSRSTRRGGARIQRYERLQHGPFYADFRRDEQLSPPVYHCVIQREGSTEILRLSQFRTLEGARNSAQRELEQLAQTESSKEMSPSVNTVSAGEASNSKVQP